MEQTKRRNGSFIAFEYKEVTADIAQASFLMDGYANFGWEIDENVMPDTTERYFAGKGKNQNKKIVIRMKRDRRILNKMELTRLQRNFEACVAEIGNLEKEKTSRPSVTALTVGILGTAFMAGSTFAVTAQPPRILLCIILAIPGFLGWILPYFLYKAGVRKQTEKMTPLIEEKYDEIYEICEKGNKLLN